MCSRRWSGQRGWPPTNGAGRPRSCHSESRPRCVGCSIWAGHRNGTGLGWRCFWHMKHLEYSRWRAVVGWVGLALAGFTAAPAWGQMDWYPRVTVVDTTLEAVTRGPELFVAVGEEGTVVSSGDGVEWDVQDSSTNAYLLGAAYGAGHYVAVGYGGAILSSRDASLWVSREAPTNHVLAAVTAGGGGLIAVGDGGTILRSTDATNWVALPSGTNLTLEAVCFGPDRAVAVGYLGAVVISTNGGLDWASVPSVAGEPWLLGVAWGAGRFVGVGWGGVVVVSTNGIDWSGVTSPTAQTLNGVTFGGDRFVAAGDAGTLLSSADGLQWVLETAGTGRFLNAAAEGGGDYVVVGNAGVMLGTKAANPVGAYRLTDYRVNAEGNVEFNVTGLAAGQPAVVQYAPSLALPVDWLVLEPVTGTGAPVLVVDPEGTAGGQRFYRLRQP